MNPDFVRKAPSVRFAAIFIATLTILANQSSLGQIGNAAQALRQSDERGRLRPGYGLDLSAKALSPYMVASHRRIEDAAYTTPLPGDVSFPAPESFNTGGYDPEWVVVADVNGDGKPDLIVGNFNTDFIYGSPSNFGVLLGNGDGTFQAPVTYASGGAFLHSVAVADVNNDGKLDIVASGGCDRSSGCSGDGSVAVLLGNGDGTFQAEVSYDSGGYTPIFSQVLVADVNGDGKPDLVVLNGCASPCDSIGPPEGSVAVLLGKGDGTFRAPVTYSSGGYFANFLAIADLNGDGKLDLVVTNDCADNNIGSCTSPAPVEVLLGNGDGTFQAAVSYSAGAGLVGSVAVADVNGDGKPDLVVAVCGTYCGAGARDGAISVLLGRGDGTFEAPVSYAAGTGSYYRLMVADVDGDGNADVIASNWNCTPEIACIDVLPGNGDGSFQGPLPFAVGFVEPISIAVADLNSDGKLDVVVANAGDDGTDAPPGTVTVLLNDTGSAKTRTETLLLSSANPSNYGQAVTFTASASSSSGTPTGTVVFYDGLTAIGNAALAGGSASLSTSAMSAGSHSITAFYQGSSSFAPSTSVALNQVVKGATTISTTTTLTTSKDPVIYRHPVTLTAVVTAASGTPSGNVTFYDDYPHPDSMGTVALSNGTATLTTSGFRRGHHMITVAYQGDGTFSPSTSAPLLQVVNDNGKYSTRMVLGTSLSPSFVGETVTLSAEIIANGKVPDGESVDFYRDGYIGSGIFHNGVASLTTSSLVKGEWLLSGYYRGDDSFQRCGTSISQVVNRYPTQTSISSSENPTVYGRPVTLTAAVASTGPNPPTGKVRLDGVLVPLVAGVASLTRPHVRVGTHAIVADYVGDEFSAPSTSPVLDEVSAPAPTTATIVSSANPSSAGQNVTFTATVTSSTGVNSYGKVTFTAGAATLGTAVLKDNTASISTTTLPVGSTTVTVTYAGTPSFTGSSASLTQTVQP